MFLPLVVLLLCTLTGTAIGQQSDKAVAEEVALARSAAPAELSDGASVYLLRDGAYVKQISGTNGFSCLVLPQDEPGGRAPVCLDPEWTRCELPEYSKMAELQKRGWSWPKIWAEVNRLRGAGAFPNPQRSGVAYMMSPQMRGMFAPDNPEGRIQPHVMIYTPATSNRQIGVTSVAEARRKRIPFVLNEGLPDAHIIAPMPAYTDGTPFKLVPAERRSR